MARDLTVASKPLSPGTAEWMGAWRLGQTLAGGIVLTTTPTSGVRPHRIRPLRRLPLLACVLRVAAKWVEVWG